MTCGSYWMHQLPLSAFWQPDTPVMELTSISHSHPPLIAGGRRAGPDDSLPRGEAIGVWARMMKTWSFAWPRPVEASVGMAAVTLASNPISSISSFISSALQALGSYVTKARLRTRLTVALSTPFTEFRCRSMVPEHAVHVIPSICNSALQDEEEEEVSLPPASRLSAVSSSKVASNPTSSMVSRKDAADGTCEASKVTCAR
mmetsp:Transcript_82746/g.173227  ORF Transcript_82746/g.173227 Transcript_82746/m.173227 type:complete len:202 (-) Transcript_82746:425-1030(-)